MEIQKKIEDLMKEIWADPRKQKQAKYDYLDKLRDAGDSEEDISMVAEDIDTAQGNYNYYTRKIHEALELASVWVGKRGITRVSFDDGKKMTI